MSIQELKHGHLVIDQNTEYLDGSLLIEKGRVKETYYDGEKVKEVSIAADIKGMVVMPAFFSTNSLDRDYRGCINFMTTLYPDSELVNNPNLGIHFEGPFVKNSKLDYVDLKQLNNLINNYNIKSMTISNDYANIAEAVSILRQKGIKIFLGYSNNPKIDYSLFDGFSNMYFNMSQFSFDGSGIVNKIFEHKEKYVSIDATKIDPQVLKFTLSNLRKDRVILIGDLYQTFKILRSLHYSYTDILLYTSLNAYRFYDLEKYIGTLHKGKIADLILIKDDEIIAVVNKGELKYV